MIVEERDNFFWYKLNGLTRWLLAHSCSGLLPLYIVNEYPRSGGTWLAQMLSDALSLPFPRNRLPILGTSILHGHYLWPGAMRNLVMLWRDGRDVIVSLYYHSLIPSEDGINDRLVRRTRKNLRFRDYFDITHNLPLFIEYAFCRSRFAPGSWADFVNKWADREVVQVRYEDLHSDCAGQLRKVVCELSLVDIGEQRASEITAMRSFSSQSGRRPGQENKANFLRKGAVGDWKAHFSAQARRIFSQYAGKALVRLGYEPDDSWA